MTIYNAAQIFMRGKSLFFTYFDLSPVIVAFAVVVLIQLLLYYCWRRVTSLTKDPRVSKMRRLWKERQLASISLLHAIMRLADVMGCYLIVTFGVVMNQNYYAHMDAFGDSGIGQYYMQSFQVNPSLGRFLVGFGLTVARHLQTSCGGGVRPLNAAIFCIQTLKWILLLYLLEELCQWEIYFWKWPNIAGYSRDNPITDWESHEWQRTYGGALEQWTYLGMFLLLAAPMAPCYAFSMLGYHQQHALTAALFKEKNGKGHIALSEVNDGSWAVPPILICNTTTHDLVEAADCIDKKDMPTPFEAFEMTSFAWGSRLTGWRPPPV